MKNSLLFAALLPLLAAPRVCAADTAAVLPAHSIANSELRVLPKNAAGRHYQLHIGLPASYRQTPDKKYPVLYVTDGYWDFETIHASAMNAVWDKSVPPFILVGIGYAGENLDYDTLRRWELPPVPVEGYADSGHAAEFLRTIEQEIIPFVEREYPADPSYRVMAGSSLGGLFTLYAMYTKPELFKGYIAVSPAALVKNDWLIGYADTFAKSGKPIGARLFMSGAENEWPSFLAGIKRMNEQIARTKIAGLQYQWRLIDGERHAGTKAEGYTRGMRWAFAPLAPETGPMPEGR